MHRVSDRRRDLWRSHPEQALSYEYLPHTADLRAAILGLDLQGLYQSSVDLVRDILVGSSEVKEREVRAIELHDDADREHEEGMAGERLFAFVRELLFLYDAEAFLPARVECGSALRVWGEGFDPERHTSERQLKAVTRHGYRFEKGPEGYRAELVFDI